MKTQKSKRSPAILMVITTFLCLLLAACTDSSKTSKPAPQKPKVATPSADVTFKEADLNLYEKDLIQSLTESAYSYDVQIHNQSKKLNILIEEYSKGKKVGRTLNTSAFADEDRPPEELKLLIARQRPFDNTETWVIHTYSNMGTGSRTYTDDQKQTDESIAVSFTADLPLHLNQGDTSVIGALIITNEDKAEFQGDLQTEEGIQEITNFDQAYLIKAEVK